MKHENLVLSNELIRSNYYRERYGKLTVRSDEANAWNETSALQIFHSSNSTFINSFDETKFSYFSFQWADTLIKTLTIKWSWVRRLLPMKWFPTCFLKTFQTSTFTSSVKCSVPAKFPRSRFRIHLLNQQILQGSYLYQISLPYKVKKRQNKKKKKRCLALQHFKRWDAFTAFFKIKIDFSITFLAHQLFLFDGRICIFLNLCHFRNCFWICINKWHGKSKP